MAVFAENQREGIIIMGQVLGGKQLQALGPLLLGHFLSPQQSQTSQSLPIKKGFHLGFSICAAKGSTAPELQPLLLLLRSFPGEMPGFWGIAYHLV